MSVTTWDSDAVITCKSITASSSYGLADGANIATGTTTGTIIAATAAQKLGFWGTAPIGRPSNLRIAKTWSE